MGDPADMSRGTHRLATGNSIIGSRRATDTDSGPIATDRPHRYSQPDNHADHLPAEHGR